MSSRIEAYIHSDDITKNKGIGVVKVNCETDFGSQTPEFIEFAKKAALFCYGYKSNWEQLEKDCAYSILELKRSTEEKIKEKITVELLFLYDLNINYWTKQPSINGWYWLKQNKEIYFKEVENGWTDFGGEMKEIEKIKGEWHGPFFPPGE